MLQTGAFIKEEFLTTAEPLLTMELSLQDTMKNKTGLSEILGDLLGEIVAI